jgi:spore coat protein SA
MNIAFITPGILPVPPVKGGAVETLIETFIKENEKYDDFKIDLFSLYEEGIEECIRDYRNIKFHYIKISKLENLLIKIFNKSCILLKIDRRLDLYLHKLRKYFKRNRIATSNFDKVLVENSYQVVGVSRIFNKKVVLHLHNDNININRKNAKEIINSCERILAVSSFIKDRVKEVDRNARVSVVYNGVDTGRFFSGAFHKNEKIILREKYNIGCNDKVIMYAGRFTSGKGIAELIKAFSDLEGNNLRLLVVGSAWFGLKSKNRFVQHLQQISAKDKERIIFTGFIHNDNIHSLYNIADIVVVPSIGNEAFPMVVIEAMSSGIPVITTNRGGMIEAVDKSCGIVIEDITYLREQLREKITGLLQDENTRQQMSRAARIKVENMFTVDMYYKNMKKAICGELQDD